MWNIYSRDKKKTAAAAAGEAKLDAGATDLTEAKEVQSVDVVAFDMAKWIRRLYGLNPWADGLEVEAGIARKRRSSADAVRTPFAQLRLQAVLTRWAEGREVWNAWAEAMWDLRCELEEAQLWSEEQAEAQDAQYIFLHCAAVEFDYLCLKGGADFSDFLFPGIASFRGTCFGDKFASPGDAMFCRALFHGGEARFDGTKFRGGAAKFRESQFHGGEASFDGAQFHGGDASFSGAQFHGGDAKFIRAQFYGGEARFIRVQFHGGDAAFQWADFNVGDAGFRGAEFHGGAARFDGVRFRSGGARFREAQFWGGDVLFRGAQFVGGGAIFRHAQFHRGNALFDRAVFDGGKTSFEGAQFLSGTVSFERARFQGGSARFIKTQFNGESTSFNGTQFLEGDTEFDDAQFHGGSASFRGAQFHGGPALFRRVQFHGGRASFRDAQFHGGNAVFSGAQFHGGPAEFRWAQFHRGDAVFRKAEFHGGDASFRGAQFHGGAARFRQAQFHGGQAAFQKAEFHGGPARFIKTQFHGGAASFDEAQFRHRNGAWFQEAQFHGGDVSFKSVNFEGHVSFSGAQFGALQGSVQGNADFQESSFKQGADYTRCQINHPISFAKASFEGAASFEGTQSNVGFTLSEAQFNRVPDFTQSVFHPVPRLDNVKVRPAVFGTVLTFSSRVSWDNFLCLQWINRDSDAPAKFRELKHFAIEAEDNRNILNFHAEEIRSARWVADWPGHPRFWFGYMYGLLSNFGRSFLRPFLLWALLTLVFSCVYFSAHLDHASHSDRYGLSQNGGLLTQIDLGRRAWWDRLPCTDGNNVSITGLPLEVLQGTDAFSQAFRMSLANALVFSDMGGMEGARLTYGCLFGLVQSDRVGVAAVTYLPPGVLWVTRLQQVMSVLLIFLFAIALRNMLK